jgi:hypothetical protein
VAPVPDRVRVAVRPSTRRLVLLAVAVVAAWTLPAYALLDEAHDGAANHCATGAEPASDWASDGPGWSCGGVRVSAVDVLTDRTIPTRFLGLAVVALLAAPAALALGWRRAGPRLGLAWALAVLAGIGLVFSLVLPTWG